MSPSELVGLGLAALAAAAAGRLVTRWLRTPSGERATPWRLAVLVGAQPLLAILLFLGLHPPATAAGGRSGTLVVATRGAPRLVSTGPDERLIGLPDAPAGLGGEPAPDLATALRRHPEAGRLRVVGVGLTPRDRDAVGGRALRFDPASPPPGLRELHGPAITAPGDAFTVSGRASGLDGGWAELSDPVGRRVDRRPLSASGGFTLQGAVREQGAVLFTVALHARGEGVVESVDLPVVTAAALRPRVLVLAGSPGPEVKALRRWGVDVGLDLRTAVSAGGGLELGDPRPPLTDATLDALDVVVVDERSWAALSTGDRGALTAAVRRGLGLLLRVTGPPSPAVRDAWRALGLPLAPGEDVASIRLPASAQAPDGSDVPELTRRGADAPSPGSTPLLRDAAGGVLARWRPEGQGRLGVWTVADSAGLTTAGFGDRYGELWSTLFATLSRPGGPPGAELPAPAVAGRRAVVCGLTGESDVTGQGAAPARLLPDADGCAAYWPVEGGWRTVHGQGSASRPTPPAVFYVRPTGQAPGVLAEEDRLATQALVAEAGPRLGAASTPSEPAGPSWAWLAAWLAAAAAVWWFERAPLGRSRRRDAGDPHLRQGTSGVPEG